MSTSDQRHLSLDELDLVRSGEALPEQARHAADCDVCRTALADLQALASEIRRARPEAPAIPSGVDAALLAQARALLPRASRSRRVVLWRSAAAAAAALLVASGVRLWLGGSVPGDVDRSGRVDIVDAYTLAVRLKSGAELSRQWDLNADGAVSTADVDAIARRAVRLEGRSP